jgi:hypothetical protein
MTDSPSKNSHSRLLWLYFFICTLVVAGIWATYTATSTDIGDGDLLMPLDDVYIHFQYAKQLANGEPYVYNPGDDASSGATSFIYPYLLAIGYKLGFTGLNLGYWAMGIGALALLASTWLIMVFAWGMGAPKEVAPLAGVLFAATGSVSWHFMSGMETGLIITLTLATFITFATGRFRLFIASATLLALTRPEGSIMAGIAVAMMAFHLWWMRRTSREQQVVPLQNHRLLLIIPVLAILVQPVVNLLLTGSISAMGAQSKSILGTIPFYWGDVIGRIWDNFVRIWRELTTGTNGDYAPVFIAPLAFIGFISLFRLKDSAAGNTIMRPYTGLMVLGWFIAVSAAVATLDTAFWHFKRYQMPLIALLYPLAVLGGMIVWGFLRHRIRARHVVPLQYAMVILVVVAIIVTTVPTWTEFHRLYEVNINNIAAQPLPMARWLNENTPGDAVVAVHDVGIMRYIGERYTIDMVGLTTPGAADAWRNGPGSVAEFLIAHDPPPDYVAAYTTARGLNYLVDTSLYGELLAGFPAEYAPEDNVALAAEFQGIFRVTLDDVMLADNIDFPMQPSVLHYLREDSAPISSINVTHVQEEFRTDYYWNKQEQSPGFISEVYEMNYVDCIYEPCVVLDGGRRIDWEEYFVPHIGDSSGPDSILLVTRLHPAFAGTLDYYINDQHVATRWIPQIPGQWLEVATVLPNRGWSYAPSIRIVPTVTDGFYMPYYHFIFDGDALKPPEFTEAIAHFQSNAIELVNYDVAYMEDQPQAAVTLNWQTDGSAEGDYKVFVHLYDNIDDAPIAQKDMYPGNGTLPPGNWLPGTRPDTIIVNTTGVPPGKYQVAIGFYNPYTLDRLMPTAVANSVWVDENSRRLFIGEIEILENE